MCHTRVLISAGSTTVGGKLYTFTKCKPTLSGRAGSEMQGGRSTKMQRNEGICQVKPLEAQPQPKLFRLGVYVLLTEEWLSLRRFQWTLYNHVATRVASV